MSIQISEEVETKISKEVTRVINQCQIRTLKQFSNKFDVLY